MEFFQSVNVLAVLVGIVLPALVALVTKQLATSRLKSLTLIGLSAIAAVLTPLVGSDVVDLQAVFSSFAVIFGTGVLSYYGVLKPTGVTDSIQSAIPGGLGPVDESVYTFPTEVDDKGDLEALIGEEIDDWEFELEGGDQVGQVSP
jgi:hypothetical protein